MNTYFRVSLCRIDYASILRAMCIELFESIVLVLIPFLSDLTAFLNPTVEPFLVDASIH